MHDIDIMLKAGLDNPAIASSIKSALSNICKQFEENPKLKLVYDKLLTPEIKREMPAFIPFNARFQFAEFYHDRSYTTAEVNILLNDKPAGTWFVYKNLKGDEFIALKTDKGVESNKMPLHYELFDDDLLIHNMEDFFTAIKDYNQKSALAFDAAAVAAKLPPRKNMSVEEREMRVYRAESGVDKAFENERKAALAQQADPGFLRGHDDKKYNIMNLLEGVKPYIGVIDRVKEGRVDKHPDFEADIYKNSQGIEIGGAAAFRGVRNDNKLEDAHIFKTLEITLPSGEKVSLQLAGVFDGHGGASCSNFCKNNIEKIFTEQFKKYNAEGVSRVGIANALKMTFVQLHKEYPGRAGSTATVALRIGDKLYTANAGDSRSIISTPTTATQLTADAEPDDPRFLSGIEARGGYVKDKRIGGGLASGRNIGDKGSTGSTPRPKLNEVDLTKIKTADGKSFVLLGCDGIFDTMTTEEVSRVIQHLTKLGHPPSFIAKCLVELASEGEITVSDDATAMLIQI